VLIVGVGGLGCAAAMTLARAGVGTIGLADPDVVEISNLHRQLLHALDDLGRTKVESAARKLAADPSRPILSGHPYAATRETIPALFSLADVVVDATDGTSTKYLLSDAAVLLGKPVCHAGVVGFGGQALTILPRQSACLRCAFPDRGEVEGPSCREAGILGPVASVLGALQAHEAIRILTGEGPVLADRILAFDGRTLRFREIRLGRDPDCPACGARAPTDAPFAPFAERRSQETS
jgi:molybdopterin-synthase adenylyltransferase